MKKGRVLLALSVATVTMLGSALTVSATGYEDLFDAEYYASQYSDVAEAFGDDEEALLQHYLTYGIKEGRSASEVLTCRIIVKIMQI